MAVTLVVGGVGYSYPQTGDSSWGDQASLWAAAVTTGMLQKAGGAFNLTADVDFGPSFGLKSAYFTSRTTNPASTGSVRLANADSVSFRNLGNTADIALKPDADGILQYGAIDLVNLSATQTLIGKVMSGAANTFTAIPYSALVFAATIVNADISASAAIAYSKLALTGSVVNADISASAAIVYSKLNLNGSVLNSDLAGSIAASKLAALAINKAMTTDASGLISASVTTSTELSYLSGVTSAIQTQFTGKQATSIELSAIAALATTGMLSRTAAGTYVPRTETGTANQISIANGDGVAGNPTYSIVSNPVLPGTDSVTLPTGTTAQRGTSVAGKLRFNSDTGAFEGYTSSWGAIAGASSSGGGINYISATDGSVIGSWAAYANTAQPTPVTGTGGSPTVTFATSTDSSLVGPQNFLFTKGASNLQGQGFSYPFNIDTAYQSKPLSVSFLYSVASGTYADGDMTAWLYDVTNSQLIQPSGSTIQNSIGATTKKLEFQTNSNSTSYRLIFHVASTSALAYTLRFDQFSVSPNTTTSGAAITAPAAYTPVFSAGFGTVTGINITWQRVGNYLEGQGTFATGTVAASIASMSLPVGLSIDTSILSQGNTTSGVGPQVGSWTGNTTNNVGAVLTATGTSGTLFYFGTNGITGQIAPQNGSTAFGSSQSVDINFRVPIQGWGVTQVLSSDTDTRVVAAVLTGAPANTTAGNPIIFPTVSNDTNGAYSTITGKYTVPVPGYYSIAASINATWTGTMAIQVYKNGSSGPVIAFGANNANLSGSTTVYANAGDLLDIRPASNTTGYTGSGYSNLSIFRLSGPAQIAASESVNCRYDGTAALATSSVIKFTTFNWDTHGAYNTTTGVFTAPIGGKYRFTLSGTYLTSGSTDVIMYKQGAADSYVGALIVGARTSVSAELNLLAGQTAFFATGASAATSADTGALSNHFYAERIGN